MWVNTFFPETETLAKTEISRHETIQYISELVETIRDETETVKNFESWDCPDAGVKTWYEPNNLTLPRHAFTKHMLQSYTDWLTSTYYCHTVIECHIKCWLHWLQTPQNCNAQTVCVMSEVRIKLRHSKTVVRQNQDETWSYETRAETRHECVETEPRNYVSRVLVLSPFTSPLARSIEVD